MMLSCRSGPVRTKTVPHRSLVKNWIGGQVLEKIKKRQNMYLLYRLNKVGHAAYKRYCSSVTSMIRKAKRTYFLKYFPSIKVISETLGVA